MSGRGFGISQFEFANVKVVQAKIANTTTPLKRPLGVVPKGGQVSGVRLYIIEKLADTIHTRVVSRAGLFGSDRVWA